MKRRTTALLGTFALVAWSGLAIGQTESRPRTGTVAAATRRPAANGHKPRIAIIPLSPPAQPVTVNTTGSVANFMASPVVTQVYYLPTVVLSDGRVLANFGTGRGYEQVLRQCPRITGQIPPNFAVAACWAVDSYGRYTVIQQR